MEYEKLVKVEHCFNKTMRRISKTIYKYVQIVAYDGIKTYRAEIPKLRYGDNFEDIRSAALMVDKTLLSHGLDPVNILKKK